MPLTPIQETSISDTSMPAGAPDSHTAVSRRASWKAQYQFATETMFTFFEWRHKVLVRYAVVVAALGVVIQYLNEEDFPPFVRAVPFAIGLFFSLSSYCQTECTQRSLRTVTRSGMPLNKKSASPRACSSP